MPAKDLLPLVILFLVGFSQPAHAYIDPGSGSLVLQLLIAAAVASLFYMKRVWRFLAGLIRRHPKSETQAEKSPAKKAQK